MVEFFFTRVYSDDVFFYSFIFFFLETAIVYNIYTMVKIEGLEIIGILYIRASEL
jgi:hypothetical protein